MHRSAWLLLWLTACHPRVEAPAETRDESTCLEAMIRVVNDRVDAGTLIVDVSETWACARGDERIVRLATVPLVEQPRCPAGQVALEAGPERVVLPDFVATLDRGHVLQVTEALREFTERDRGQFGRAFVVSCAPGAARWFFLRTMPTPVVQTFEAREAVATRQPSPTLQLEREEAVPDDGDERPARRRDGGVPDVDERLQLRRGSCTESLEVGASVWRGRTLSTGLMPGPSFMTVFTLGRTKSRGALVVQEFKAGRPGPPDDAQPSGEWECVSSSTSQGTIEGGSTFVFRLGERVLRCTPTVVNVADATSRRVRVPSKEEGCNASRWAPATRRELKVLSCVDPADAQAGTGRPILLSTLPGVEHVTSDNDDCGDPKTALRRIPADGGVAPAMRISEQPADSVPADMRRPRTP
ncbi:MAG: hypothetical protein Q8L14_17280 [Myxococcales bacterium]|nr:hypothetical protein [Myxococcales bacterium]